MKILILSGVGGSTNWLPLVLPLACIVAILYSIDLLVRFIKKRKLNNENKLANDLTAPIDNSDSTHISDI